MPGGRSLGCKTCKQRKVKCDETRPICIQCERSGRHCPGALTPFVYQAEMVKAELSQQQAKSSKREIRWRPVMEAAARSRSRNANLKMKTPAAVNSKADLCSLIGCSSSFSAGSPLGRRLAYMLDSTRGTGCDLLICGEWLPELACRIGHSDALDAAIDTLLLSHYALITPGSVNCQQHGRAYGRALRMLRDGLQSRDHNVQVEVLCAGLALCTSEAMSAPDAQHTGWLSHSGGSAAMLQACGTHWFKNHFARSLLYHQAPQFIASALVTRGKCFLDCPEWISVFNDQCQYIGRWDELQAKLVPVYATLPALMRDIEARSSLGHNVDSLLERAWEFRRQLFSLDNLADRILTDSDSVIEMPSTSPGSPLQVCYQFGSALIIQPLLLYWRLIIIIDNIIQTLSATAGISNDNSLKELQVSSIHAADQIAMSAEQARHSVPIVSTLHGFSLPAAIAAYSNWEFRPWKSKGEIQWLTEGLHDCLAPMSYAMRSIMVSYFGAVGLPHACVSLPTGIGISVEA